MNVQYFFSVIRSTKTFSPQLNKVNFIIILSVGNKREPCIGETNNLTILSFSFFSFPQCKILSFTLIIM